MTLRLHVLLAIARRDLSAQLRGRRGWVLPFIAAILLAPLAAAPLPSLQGPPPGGALAVSGDIPAAVLELPTTAEVPEGGIAFRQTDTHLEVQGPGVPDDLRAALDGADSRWTFHHVPQEEWPLPGRSLALALLASSILTGAVSESLPGERSRKTLEPLLTAAVSRPEIVLGKWLAWAGFGAVAASAAGLVAVLFGTMPLGWWLIVLPTVPMGTVALGLFLVRRARDVVGGATVSLRVLPAVLSILGIVAWFIGLGTPELGAAIPLGGALVAAGGTWAGPVAPLLAAGITLAGTAALLALTSRDLEQMQRALQTVRITGELWSAAWVLLAWWVGLGAAAVWVAAGNPVVGGELDATPALLAAAVGALAVLVVRAASDVRPADLVGLLLPGTIPGWLAAVLGGLALVPVGLYLHGVLALPLPDFPAIELLFQRQSLGLWPLASAPLAGALGLLVQELVFRGWLQRQLGPVAATVAFAVVVTPLDPVQGLVIGGVLAAVTWLSKGSVWPAVVARLLAATVVAVTATLGG